MVIHWVFWWIGILFSLLPLSCAIEMIRKNKEARFPDWFNPALYIILFLGLLYMLITNYP